MAIKRTLYVTEVSLHNDNAKEGERQVEYREIFVLAKNPAQVTNKLIRTFGDQLILIERITLVASTEQEVVDAGSTIVKLVA